MAAPEGARGGRGDPDTAEVERHLGALAGRRYVRAALSALGQPGSRFEIATPAAVVDVGALEHNIALDEQAMRDVGHRPAPPRQVTQVRRHRPPAAGGGGGGDLLRQARRGRGPGGRRRAQASS